MAHYVIGDIHGCFDSLMALVDKIQFNPAKDVIYCVGDLVGRGPKPLDVLRFIVNTPNIFFTLGNHDLWCMAVAYGCHEDKNSEFHHLFQTKEDLVLLNQWRQQAQLFITNKDLRLAIVHAGIPPQWSLQQTEGYASEVISVLHGSQFKAMLGYLEGDTPHCWQQDLKGHDRYRYIVNALTRMRFSDAQGCLDFKEKDVMESKHKHLQPWFKWPNQLGDYRLFYGHWAALGGDCSVKNIIATDTGCVYGGFLTAYKIIDKTLEPTCFQIASKE